MKSMAGLITPWFGSWGGDNRSTRGPLSAKMMEAGVPGLAIGDVEAHERRYRGSVKRVVVVERSVDVRFHATRSQR